MLKLLFAALLLCAVALLLTPPSLSAILVVLTIAAAPFLLPASVRVRLARRLDRRLATLAAMLGLSALAACNDKPRVEPTPPATIEPCRPGQPFCTPRGGQRK